MEKEYVMVCPKCKSPDIYVDKSNKLQPALGVPTMYGCNNCGHSGYTFPEVEISELEEFEEEIRAKGLAYTKKDKTPLVDVQYGNFVVRVIWKVTSPILVVLGIILFSRNIFLGGFVTFFGLVLFYITYFRKSKLRD